MRIEISRKPVLLVHPDAEEAEYLVSRLREEGIAHPTVVFSTIDEARDYIETVALAGAERFGPCAILLDEKLGERFVRTFTDWAHAQPTTCSARIVILSGRSDRDDDHWGADETVQSAGQLDSLAGLLARECPP